MCCTSGEKRSRAAPRRLRHAATPTTSRTSKFTSSLTNPVSCVLHRLRAAGIFFCNPHRRCCLDRTQPRAAAAAGGVLPSPQPSRHRVAHRHAAHCAEQRHPLVSRCDHRAQGEMLPPSRRQPSCGWSSWRGRSRARSRRSRGAGRERPFPPARVPTRRPRAARGAASAEDRREASPSCWILKVAGTAAVTLISYSICT